MTQTLYRYRPASLWALVRLLIADKHDRQVQQDTRDAIWCAYKIRRVENGASKAQEAVKHAMDMLEMFSGGVDV